MTQRFVGLCAVGKCVYFWSGNPVIGLNRETDNSIELKHNIKKSKQLNWFQKVNWQIYTEKAKGGGETEKSPLLDLRGEDALTVKEAEEVHK